MFTIGFWFCFSYVPTLSLSIIWPVCGIKSAIEPGSFLLKMYSLKLLLRSFAIYSKKGQELWRHTLRKAQAPCSAPTSSVGPDGEVVL